MKTRTPWIRFLLFSFVFVASAVIAQDERSESKNGQEGDKAVQPEGKELFLEAYELTKGEKAIDNLTRVIELCEQGLKAELDAESEGYGRRLLAWAQNRRGEAYAEADPPQEEEALADFEAALKNDSTKWKYYHNRGVSYGLGGEFEKAEEDFTRVIRMNSRYAKAHYNRGEVRTRLGKSTDALRDYTQAIRLDPRDSAAFNSRGFAYYSQNERSNALSDFNQAVRLDSENYEALTNRGNLYADMGRLGEAIRDFQAAIRINENYAPAYVSAAWFRATAASERYRDAQLALRSANKAIELDGESARYLDVLAAAHARAGDFDAAVETAEKAAEMADPNQAEEIKQRIDQYKNEQAYVDRIQRTSRR